MRVLGPVVSFVLVAASAAAVPNRSYWLEPAPAVPEETALREVLTRGGFAGPAATADALRQFSAAHAGTVASGLAELAAGMLLVESNHPTDALVCLRHPDVARTALPEYALRATAQALEDTGDLAGAGGTYLATAQAAPQGPLACPSLFKAAEVATKAGRVDAALDAARRALAACAGQEPRALLTIATLEEKKADLKAAAAAYDRIDAEWAPSAEAKEAGRRLALLAAQLPALSADERAARERKRASDLFEAGRFLEAASAYRTLKAKAKGDDLDLARLRLGRALVALGRLREGRAELAAIPATSPQAAEAAFQTARLDAKLSGRPDAYETVAAGFAGTPWAEEALLSLANHYQKDAKDDEALPYYRRLAEGYPQGRYAERAVWHVAWADYRAGRYELAAQALERAARTSTSTNATAGFLYWAGRARLELGQSDHARELLAETVQRFKHGYYGALAAAAAKRLPPTETPVVATFAASADATGEEIAEPHATRLRQLLLVDRLDEARDELQKLPPNRTIQATIAWIESRRGRLRPALVAMKRAYPEWVGEAGDRLPDDVWRIMYPIDYSGLLLQKSAEEGLDPALVAALICQESTFNAGAVSAAGARGLMQVIPKTGRVLAHALNRRYANQTMYDPNVSITFGTRYLREMLDRFGGRVERALAAYNAGPHRVDAWTADRPDVGAEEFVESIPFTETRNYVMIILANREQYRRIYSMPPPPSLSIPTAAAPAAAAARAAGGGT